MLIGSIKIVKEILFKLLNYPTNYMHKQSKDPNFCSKSVSAEIQKYRNALIIFSRTGKGGELFKNLIFGL